MGTSQAVVASISETKNFIELCRVGILVMEESKKMLQSADS
jgi:hypothetical protein